MSFHIFRMERWQSTWEHEVAFNLSESGVEPLSLAELAEVADVDLDELASLPLEYNVSRGRRELRQRIADLYADASPEEVLVTNGGAEANFVLAWSLLEPGDDLVYVHPNYMQLPGLVENFGGRTVRWPLREDSGWLPDPGELDRLVGGKTRAILVTHPNNPTGSILPEETMDAVVAAAERVGAWVIADEIYRGAELDGDEAPTFRGRSDRVVVTSGLSKAYGLPGLRLGWILAPDPAMAEELWAHKDYTSISMGTLSDHLATAALTPAARQRLLERTRRILNDNWPVLESWLRERDDAFRWQKPEAGAIVYVGYDLPVSSADLAERLRTEADCLIVPGAHFDMGDYVRLGFGPPVDRLRAGLERCARVIDPLRDAG